MSKIKISGFYDEVSSNLKTQLDLMKELGESYICPRNINGKSIAAYTLEEFEKDVKPMLDEYGAKFSSIGSPIGKCGLTDDEAYEAQKKKLAELVKICKLMDCKYIRIFSFKVKPENYDEEFPMVVEKIRGFLDIVRGTDIVLIHENEKGIWGDEPNRVLKLYNEINDPQFKLCFDASNYIQCGYDAPQAYELLKDYTVYYHIKDCSLDRIEVPVGYGAGNYKGMIEDLIKNRNYEGFMTLEPHTHRYANAKLLFNVVWPLAICIKPGFINKWHKVFKQIDKFMGIKTWQKVSLKEVFVWQHQGLKKILNEVEGE